MKKTRLYFLLFSAVVLTLLTVGVSYAWFAQNASMTTLLNILPPDTITIIPVDRNDKNHILDELKLEFHEGTDDTNVNGKITIYRPVCVKSTNPSHKLEIVHTTNLTDFTFNVYLAEIDGKSVRFSRNQSGECIPLVGEYKNQKENSPGLAKQDLLDNYKNGDTVEAHAYPLYWLPTYFSSCALPLPEGATSVISYTNKEFDSVSGTDKTFYYTYYYLEISWKETTKETDLFYIMAQNVAQ